MYTIESNVLKVSVRTKGAELDSIYNKAQQLEYLWSGDPAFWGKKSPILFPIVGTLKKDTYIFNGKEYHLSRHGFARDMEFAVTRQEADSVTLTLESNADTLLKFPFSFRFDISYTVSENRLEVAYRVTNTGQGNMYFSVGAHPAFKVPLAAGTAYEDYSLVFNQPEQAPRWPISKDGLIEATPQALLDGSGRLPLRKELFRKDALVFKHLRSDKITLQSAATAHGWSVSFPGFPFMGIW
ncbi:MAG TPA: aldose 1-epimerase family protein, partial [Chitinophagaceae bacterium]|nr:aldose 1-epimerase family protein [Chitinophagaceae bacterium]